jgi:hypothetical protein
MDTARKISAAQTSVRLNTDRDGCFHSACNSSGHEGDPLGRVNLDWVNWGISFRGGWDYLINYPRFLCLRLF